MREQSKPNLVVGHGASTIGTPDYVPPNEVEKLREAVPRAVNALADAMEQLERQRPVVEAAVAAVAYIRGRLGDRIEDRLPLMPASSQALYRAVEAMQKAEKGGCDDA